MYAMKTMSKKQDNHHHEDRSLRSVFDIPADIAFRKDALGMEHTRRAVMNTYQERR